VLGCASSPGVPRVNGDWGACDPHNPKNRRTRAAFLIRADRRRWWRNDNRRHRHRTGFPRTDDRRNKVHKIDGVLYTHPHADHVHGIDDLRDLRARSASASRWTSPIPRPWPA
jgi:phosphoribosyl 1,2-cyclic phosphate phosphodiesterase